MPTPSTRRSSTRWPTSARTRQFGCGRALWENNGDTGAYGTTMALMLLPHWTDGCIASQEGLFFEASGTTPYHFLTAAAMSANSSNPVRELRYTDNNAAVGVPDDAEDGHQVPDGVHAEGEEPGGHAQRPHLGRARAGRGRSTPSPTATWS